MTKQEFAVWAAALQTYYPRHQLLPNQEAMSLWYQELKDCSSAILTAALRKWVTTERWPPTIAELRSVYMDIVGERVPDWGEAWNEVKHAIGKYGYMRRTEALESMSPTTRRAVEQIGWQDICESEEPEVIRAQFRSAFEACARRAAENRRLPQDLRVSIDGFRSNGTKMLGE